MSISFEIDERVAAVAQRTTEFVRDVVIPEEQAYGGGDVHAGPEPLRRRLQEAARAAGVFAPHVGEEFGGLGLDLRDQAVVFEAAGRSLLGPLALNCAAPDEGNMHLLEVVATQEQKERYLRPLAAGEVRSCFAMTEPATRGRIRSARAGHHGDPDGRRLADRRPQVVHQRRRRGGLRHLHGPHQRRSGRRGRRDDVPRRRRRPRV